MDDKEFCALLHEAIPNIEHNISNKCGNTLLHMAIEKKASDIALRLLESKHDVNKKNNMGFTPLMYAVIYDDVLVAHEILRLGADINEQNVLGNTALHYTYRTGNLEMLDLLIRYHADPRIKNHAGHTFLMLTFSNCSEDLTKLQFQKRAIEIQADMNQVCGRGISTLLFGIQHGTPLLEEIINKGADVNYFRNDMNALSTALKYRNRKAFELIWPKFDYHYVYVLSNFRKPLLCEFFYNRNREWGDWFYCYGIVSNSDRMKHAVQHYTRYDSLPPLISKAVLSFARHGYSENDFFRYVLTLISNGARVFLEDIETVYICCKGNQKTVKYLLDADVILKPSVCYHIISHPYVMLQVSRDVDSIFNDDYQMYHNFVSWQRQLMFLPTLFRYCTPSHTFIRKLQQVYNYIETQEGLDTDYCKGICAAYRVRIDPLTDNICFPPCLVELSRNAARKAICSWYKIEQYSEYRRLLLNSDLPRVIVNILLFRKEVTEINIPFPDTDILDTIRAAVINVPIYRQLYTIMYMLLNFD